MSFLNERAGLQNLDDNSLLEQGIDIPWMSDPAGSYVYYDCTVGAVLDSGLVVHNRLPTVNNTADTLAATFLDDAGMDAIKDMGVQLTCRDQYRDIVQRMGHARYWFRIWGQALRIGYQVPIPGIKLIGGRVPVPYDRNPQWGYNRIFPGGNFGGLVLWHAQWSLWYTVTEPPTTNYVPAADPSAHISGVSVPPNKLQAPWTVADDNAAPVKAAPGLITQGGT